MASCGRRREDFLFSVPASSIFSSRALLDGFCRIAFFMEGGCTNGTYSVTDVTSSEAILHNPAQEAELGHLCENLQNKKGNWMLVPVPLFCRKLQYSTPLTVT
jgi:hypothetical protein